MNLPFRATVKEAAAILRLSRRTLYERVKEGKLKLLRDGGRTFITGVELARYQAACEAENAESHA